jgi:hypothetical protein
MSACIALATNIYFALYRIFNPDFLEVQFIGVEQLIPTTPTQIPAE